MRQVDEVHHPERDRQADREQEQKHPVGQPVEQHAEHWRHERQPLRSEKFPSVLHALLHRILDVLDLVDFHVEKLVADLLDLEDVHGLDDVAGFWIDGERTARAFPAHALGGGDQRFAVGVAVGLLQRFVDEPRAVIAADRIDVWVTVELLIIGLYERGTFKPDLSALFTFIHSFVRPEEPILSSRP
jgi:hypothetical protein